MTPRPRRRSSPTHRRILQPPSSSQILVTPLEKERKKRGEAGSSAPLPSSARLHSGGWRHTRVLPPSTHQRRGESLSHFLLPPPLREYVALAPSSHHPPPAGEENHIRAFCSLLPSEDVALAPSSPHGEEGRGCERMNNSNNNERMWASSHSSELMNASL